MEAAIYRNTDVIEPDENEREMARVAAQQLANLGAKKVCVQIGDGAHCVALSSGAVRLLARALEIMSEGDAVVLTPLHSEISTQQAAEIMKVSRPYLVKLLDEGAITSHKVGTHRRVRLHDVLEYKRENDEKRLAALEELQAEAQALGLY